MMSRHTQLAKAEYHALDECKAMISHLYFDHVGEIREILHAELFVSQVEWEHMLVPVLHGVTDQTAIGAGAVGGMVSALVFGGNVGDSAARGAVWGASTGVVACSMAGARMGRGAG
jgi:hypothetical protein